MKKWTDISCMIAIAITESNVMVERRRSFACKALSRDLVFCFNKQMPKHKTDQRVKALVFTNIYKMV